MPSHGVNGGSLPKRSETTSRLKEMSSYFSTRLLVDCCFQKEGKLVRL
jgi:hypothetical protein